MTIHVRNELLDGLLDAANGNLELPLGFNGAFATIEVVGGPYMHFPCEPTEGLFGLCLREERPPCCSVWLPIEDFSVPSDPIEVSEAIKAVILAALDGETVYIGCLGGWGRTGLFLSLLAKAAGVRNPVEYVRKNYTSRAVETKGQYSYVTNYDVSELRSWIFWTCWSRWWRRKVFWWLPA